jgi:hypothetical protein
MSSPLTSFYKFNRILRIYISMQERINIRIESWKATIAYSGNRKLEECWNGYISGGIVKTMPEKESILEIMAREELITERIDDNGEKWIKKYFGGGAHFLNWLEQYEEVYGEKNVEIEEIQSRGFSCFEIGNEKMYRIWVKERK